MNLTKITEKFIQEKPYIRHCLRKGLINYSSLARMIAAENKLDIRKNFDALLIACRRYRDKTKKEKHEEEMLDLLKGSRIEVKNRIMTAVLERGVYISHLEELESRARKDKEVFRVVEGASAITLITSEGYSGEIRNIFRNYLIKETKGLVEVTLKTSKEIENIPGVLSFLYSLFAEHDINIAETMSCWTDTIFVIEEKYLAKTMEILRF